MVIFIQKSIEKRLYNERDPIKRRLLRDIVIMRYHGKNIDTKIANEMEVMYNEQRHGEISPRSSRYHSFIYLALRRNPDMQSKDLLAQLAKREGIKPATVRRNMSVMGYTVGEIREKLLKE